jgi:hypothetical protein
LKIVELGFAAKYYFSNFAVLKKGPSVDTFGGLSKYLSKDVWYYRKKSRYD